MIIIYGKPEGCQLCGAARILCEMKRQHYEYKLIGVDATPDELTLLAGVPIRSAPAIFEREPCGLPRYIGGYQELRQWLKHNNPRNNPRNSL